MTQRLPDLPCPRCQHGDTVPVRNYGRPVAGETAGTWRWQCLACGRHFDGPALVPSKKGPKKSISREVRRAYKIVAAAAARVTFKHAAITTVVETDLEANLEGGRGRIYVTLDTRDRDSGEEVGVQFGDDIPTTITTHEEAIAFIYDRARHAWIHELNEAMHVDRARRRDLHVAGTAKTLDLRITETVA